MKDDTLIEDKKANMCFVHHCHIQHKLIKIAPKNKIFKNMFILVSQNF